MFLDILKNLKMLEIRAENFFFTAFHRISYENSSPNLDPGMVFVWTGTTTFSTPLARTEFRISDRDNFYLSKDILNKLKLKKTIALISV